MIPIAKPVLLVTVRTGILWLLRKIADETGVSRARVLDAVLTVLANDQNLRADLSEDDLLDLR